MGMTLNFKSHVGFAALVAIWLPSIAVAQNDWHTLPRETTHPTTGSAVAPAPWQPQSAPTSAAVHESEPISSIPVQAQAEPLFDENGFNRSMNPQQVFRAAPPTVAKQIPAVTQAVATSEAIDRNAPKLLSDVVPAAEITPTITTAQQSISPAPEPISEPVSVATATAAVPTSESETEKGVNANVPEYEPVAMPEPIDLGSLATRLILGTVTVLVMCVVSLKFAKPWLAGGAMTPKATGELKIVDTLLLPNRSRVHLVEVRKRLLVVGIDATGLKSIQPLNEPFSAALSDFEHGPELTEFEKSTLTSAV